jgi:copper chaperone NosL
MSRAHVSVLTLVAAVVVATGAIAGCASRQRTPAATLDPAHENCANCRMQVSAQKLASQLVGPGEEPRFFDDLGCLSTYLQTHAAPRGAVVYVADHRTGEWVRAAVAVFTRVPALETPMGSQTIGHASATSRDLDRAAAGGEPIDRSALFKGEVPDGPRE